MANPVMTHSTIIYYSVLATVIIVVLGALFAGASKLITDFLNKVLKRKE